MALVLRTEVYTVVSGPGFTGKNPKKPSEGCPLTGVQGDALAGPPRPATPQIRRLGPNTNDSASQSTYFNTEKGDRHLVGCLHSPRMCRGEPNDAIAPRQLVKLGQLCWLGLPHSCQILSSWSKSDDPGNIGRRVNISPNTQLLSDVSDRWVLSDKETNPIPHISTSPLYCLAPSRSSGGRY